MADKNTTPGVPGRASMTDIVAGARAARAAASEEEQTPPVENPIADEPEEVVPDEPEQEENEVTEEENEENREENPDSVVLRNEGEVNSQDGEDLVTIIVDGEEQQVARDKVYEQGIRTLQKESAADKRLAEASQKFRDAQDYEARVRKQVEEQLRTQQRQDNEGQPLSKKQDADVKAKARQIIDKILDGNEEEAADALAEAMTGRQESTPGFDEQHLVQEAAKKVQRNLDRQTGVQQFQERYAHIVNDPNLYEMADQETIKLAKENPDWMPSKVILEAGKKVDDWLKSVGGGPKDKSDTPPSSRKAERKRTTDNLKTAKSAKVPKEPEKRPPTNSEVVARMRKSRGLPNY
jgi:hypothetical protein